MVTAPPHLRLRTLDEAQEPRQTESVAEEMAPDSVVLRLGRGAGQRDYATVGRDVLDQKFQLVRESLPIGYKYRELRYLLLYNNILLT